MDYTKYVLKSEEELKDLLAEKDNFFVVTCNKCFKEFETTQEPECRCLMDLAEAQGKHITGSVNIDFLCNKVQTEKKLAGICSRRNTERRGHFLWTGRADGG